MANTFSPFGFRQFGRREGGAPTAGLEALTLNSSYASAIFTGDLVAFSSAATSLGAGTIILCDPSSGHIPIGVFMGCEYYSATIGRKVWNSYFPGGVGTSSGDRNTCVAYVCTDPEQLYIAQVSTTSGVTGSSVIGFNISFCSSLQSAGNTTTGVSNLALASSALGFSTTAIYEFRVVDTYQNVAPPGVNGTSTGSEGAQILVVQPNNFARRTLTPAST